MIPTNDELAAIEARANAATAEPWHLSNHSVEPYVVATNKHGVLKAIPVGLNAQYENPADAIFIASARSDIPILIAAMRKLKTQLNAQIESANRVVENAYIAESMIAALRGEKVTDFAESFWPVQEIIDMRIDCHAFEQQNKWLTETNKAYHSALLLCLEQSQGTEVALIISKALNTGKK